MASESLPKHADTAFQRWHRSLSPEEKRAFAKRLGISQNMVRSNYIIPIKQPLLSTQMFKKRARGNPNQEKMHEIAAATLGACDYADMVEHFVPKEIPE